MTRRRPGNIPLSRWLTSANPVLREKAETLLYHLGPDAGEVLLHAAEEESRYGRQWRVLLLFPPQILLALGFFYLAHQFFEVQQPLLYGLLGFTIFRSGWELGVDMMSRRTRLKVIALALAKRNDLRSIGPLIEIWRPVGMLGRTISDDDVEHELERLLPIFMKQSRLSLRNDKLRILRYKVSDLLRRHRYVFQSDLSDARADLLVLFLQLMARASGERNRVVLRRLAHLTAAKPNAQLVCEAAGVLQNITYAHAIPAVESTHNANANANAPTPRSSLTAPTTTPSVQPLGIRRP